MYKRQTQDIALDAFRIESAPPDRQAVLAANYQTGYRLATVSYTHLTLPTSDLV